VGEVNLCLRYIVICWSPRIILRNALCQQDQQKVIVTAERQQTICIVFSKHIVLKSKLQWIDKNVSLNRQKRYP